MSFKWPSDQSDYYNVCIYMYVLKLAVMLCCNKDNNNNNRINQQDTACRKSWHVRIWDKKGMKFK